MVGNMLLKLQDQWPRDSALRTKLAIQSRVTILNCNLVRSCAKQCVGRSNMIRGERGQYLLLTRVYGRRICSIITFTYYAQCSVLCILDSCQLEAVNHLRASADGGSSFVITHPHLPFLRNRDRPRTSMIACRPSIVDNCTLFCWCMDKSWCSRIQPHGSGGLWYY